MDINWLNDRVYRLEKRVEKLEKMLWTAGIGMESPQPIYGDPLLRYIKEKYPNGLPKEKKDEPK